METEKEDYKRLMYIAGALEMYYQYVDKMEDRDKAEANELREKIKPLVDELRAIRKRSSQS